MTNKNHLLRFRAVNRDIFEAIKRGKKKVETRAASPKFLNMKAGDDITLVCGKERFKKKIKKVRKFSSIKDLLGIYKPQEINSQTINLEESEKMYYSFPGYRQKIKKYGLIAMEL